VEQTQTQLETDSRPCPPPKPRKPRTFGAWVLVGLTLLLAGAFFAGRYSLPFGIEMPAFAEGEGKQSVDPRAVVRVTGIGLGAQITRAELRDGSGQVIARLDQPRRKFQPNVALEFGQQYSLSVTAERPWLGQQETRETRFGTITLPKVVSNPRQELAPDGTLKLSFSEPVGAVTTSGDLKLAVQGDASRQNFVLTAEPGQYAQGKTYKLKIGWETRTGVPLNPFKMEVSTAPALGAVVATHGLSNLGLALPVQIDFSEPLQAREGVTDHIRVTSDDGYPISGKWLWFGKQRVQFSPQSGWPAESTVHVAIDPEGLRGARGGFLPQTVNAQFKTGADRRIEVYLDKQRVNVIENGEVIKTLKASTGKSKTPTVTGNFYIYARFPTKTMKSTGKKPGDPGYYEVKDVPYAQYFHEGYAFHGAFWHNNFGHPASHGCVNLATRKKNGRKGVNEDAGWLYQWASLGVPVTVYRTAPGNDQVAISQ